MIHTVKGFGIVKAEVDVFLELSCFFVDPTDVGNLISGSSAFSKSSLSIWKFTVHELLKPGLENFVHYFARMWDECNCAVVWAFSSIAFLWDWNENWLQDWKRSVFNPIPVRTAIMKNSTSKKSWRDCGDKGTLLHCLWECKLVQSL